MSVAFDPKAFFTAKNAPEAARTLGWTLVEADSEAGRLRVAFDGKLEFTNPAGLVQGGFLAAMLDDVMGPAILVKSRGKKYATTIDLHTHYLRPVRPGRIEVEAIVTQLGRQVAYVEGKLFDARGRLCARATCSSMIVSNPFAEKADQPSSQTDA
ncbi:PaaI family thioesterase [Hyphobacterium sp.]|uniref:PaaI family thioesterase n=1 Tax=Hyphobacterium sp. TaxID=2004662 RepID=UPI003BAB4EF0